VPIELKGTADDAADSIDEVVAATADVQKANPGLTIGQAGNASVNAGVWKQVGSDLGKAEKLSLPITFALMLIAFGALIAAGIPVLLAFSAVGAALGLLRAAIVPVPRRRLGRERRPADRDGGRRRLLAVLSQA
jgi:RND superfamily putative drug exporter